MTSKRRVPALLTLSALVLMLSAISVSRYGDHAAMHARQMQTEDGPVVTPRIEVKP